MLVDDLLEVSESLKKMFLPIKNERYDWKNAVLGGRKYFLNLVCNIRHGFETELIPSFYIGNSLETQYLKDGVVFKYKKANIRYGSVSTVRLLTDEDFCNYMEWNESILKEYVNYMKNYAVGCI